MTKIIHFKNDNGTEVLIEAREPEGEQEGTELAGRGDRVRELAQQTFEAALTRLCPLAQAVVKTAKELNNPSEIAVEFGIKVSAEAGVIVTSVQAEANFKISLKWKNE